MGWRVASTAKESSVYSSGLGWLQGLRDVIRGLAVLEHQSQAGRCWEKRGALSSFSLKIYNVKALG